MSRFVTRYLVQAIKLLVPVAVLLLAGVALAILTALLLTQVRL